MKKTQQTIRLASLSALLIAGLVGCASTPATPAAEPSASTATAGSDSYDSAVVEVASVTPRILLAHDGGLTLIDQESGEVVDTVERIGFLRLNDAGDGRHVVVTNGDEFLLYDGAIQIEPHGDHSHYYQGTPGLTGVTFDAPRAGHVVVHEGNTTLFADGTGVAVTINTNEIATAGAAQITHDTGAAHHGVAVQLSDGTTLSTAGTTEGRNTVEAFVDHNVVASTDACPGVHGEAVAADEVVVFGCEDGPVIWRDGEFHKVTPADAYARSGNLAGHEDSSIVLGDYKVEQGAEAEHPTRVVLIDTATASQKIVELGSPYWFRSLARGPQGEALVLVGDGSLRIVDPVSGEQIGSVDAVTAWEEPAEWQQPGPVLKVAGDYAYVTDPAANELVIIDIAEQQVVQRWEIPAKTVEMAVVTGRSAAH